jgi:hypothetical protein
MPRTARALTLTAREHATRTGTSYTQARAAVVAIHQLAVEDDLTFAQAQAVYDDPANELLCDVCGWTMGMICPEYPGCGCNQGCKELQCSAKLNIKSSSPSGPGIG